MSPIRDQRAQDTFEYMLVVGAVMTLMVAGLFAFDAIISGFVAIVCPSVDPVGFADTLQCITG